MSRCGYDGLPERKHYPGVEMPLPSYEEVVGVAGGGGASSREVAFKPEAQLLGQGQHRHQEAGCGLERGHRRRPQPPPPPSPRDDAERHYEPIEAPRSNKTAIVLALLGLIIVPMCAMIIILQIKVCASPHNNQQAEVTCTPESRKLLDDYKKLFFEKERLENTMRSLVKQLNNVTIERERLQQILGIGRAASRLNGTAAELQSLVGSTHQQADFAPTAPPPPPPATAERKKTVEDHLSQMLGKKINGVISSNEFLQTVNEAQKIFQTKS